MKYIDLTHEFKVPMPVYPGDKPPEMIQITTVEKDGFATSHTVASMHVGTHIDAPAHMVAGGKYLSEYSPEHFYGRGVLIDARGKVEIDETALQGVQLKAGDIVLVLTGFSKKYTQKEYFETYPVITDAFAHSLVAAKVHVVGFDSPSPDKAPFAVHRILLSGDVLILENLLGLEQLLGIEQFDIAAFPPKFHSDGAPVRVVAMI